MTAWKTQPTPNEPQIVLIVSQDSKMAAAWELVFKQKGYYFVHEKTSRHALQAARLLAPALVIVDLDLTQPEKLSLCQELRPLVSRALLLLASTARNDEPEYRRAGVDEWLLPAVSPSVLLGRSMTWLAN